MAKKPLPRRSPGAAAAAAGRSKGPAPAQSEAVGRFDRFSAFGLALPCVVVGLAAIFFAVGYTFPNHDVGFLGILKKTSGSWDNGAEAVRRVTGSPQILGFEQTGYMARTSDGEVDVAVLNVGSANNVNLGDVFTLTSPVEGVRLEFLVFDLQENISRAYILLGQDTARARQYSLRASDIHRLCGNRSTNIDVKREWRDQLVRRFAEERIIGN
jgi:hypothetical protein